MPLIVTPGQLAKRSDFYHQLGQLTNAGLGILQALQQIERHPPARSFRDPARRVALDISAGHTFSEAMAHLPGWLPEFDLALINAGEKSGRLDQSFFLLAEYYADRARTTRQMLVDLAYPAFLFHFAIFIFPFASFFMSGNVWLYCLRTFGILIPIYVLVFAGIFAAQGRHGETWRGAIEHLVRAIPVLGTARRFLAIARLAAALEALINAGVSIIDAWELAAAACGSPALNREIKTWKSPLTKGNTPAELVNSCRMFPELFSSQYASAELSGKLDETLKRLHKYFQEEGTRKMRAAAQWTPKIIYLVVALGIAYKVISFYAGYFKMVGEAGGF